MALSLFCINKCQFDNCGLYFASLSDLIQHIEETHLPEIENMRKKAEEEKSLSAQPSPVDGAIKSNTSAVGPALPLSTIYRLFPVLPPHKAQPIKYEPTKISFYHYRKKQVALATFGSVHYSQPNFIDKYRTSSRSEHDEEVSNDSFRTNEEDGDTREPNDERRHKCPVEGCNKRYKNLQGARYHARTIHGLNEDSPLPVTAESIMLGNDGQSPLSQGQTVSKAATVRPYKCSQCSKRYKTVSNLNKHVQDTHQRVIQNYNNHGIVNNLSLSSPVSVSHPVYAQKYQNGPSQEPVMVGTQTQVPVTVNPNHNTPSSSPGIHLAPQQPQAVSPSNSGSYQYQQCPQTRSYSPSPVSTAVPVRTVTSTIGRSNSNPGTVINYSSMVDGSQQTDSSMHIVQQRLPPVASTNSINRPQYSSEC
ncbi:unnamed protein product [Enterobius vermicularis]|uniref:C2H2-type domain-containing protein n=1 Tax=Enterobius vermicularis TaxID=51028 RepID=A0A0N4VBF4_ENTVE|nr:unnamed protein product [Enterobius vermicularis]